MKRFKLDAVLVLLFVGIAAFHVVTMPKMFYPGDNFAPRAEAANWIMTGQLGLDYSWRPRLGGFLEQRGQYLFENDEKRLFYSKYGFANTLLYLPPLLAEKLYAGKVDGFRGTRTQMLFLNIYQVLFSLGAVAYLYGLTSFFTKRKWLRVLFIVLSVYTTMLWHYLRAPTMEIFQITPFLGFCYHSLRYLRGRTAGADGSVWRHLAAAVCWAGVIVLLKASFVLLFVAVWPAAFLVRPERQACAPPGTCRAFSLVAGLVSNVFANLRKDYKRYILWLLLPSVFFAVCLLGVNYYKFDDPFESGYQQWKRKDGSDFMKYSVEYAPKAFKEFFITGNNNANVWITYPLFLFAVFGVWSFTRRHTTEALFLGFVFVTNLFAMCCLSFHTGEWCYGPRYLLHVLIIGSLPFITLCELILRLPKKRVLAGAMLAVVLAVVSAWSFRMQWHMNSLHYFTFYYASSIASGTAKSIQESVLKSVPPNLKDQWEERLSTKRDEIRAYFRNPFHRGLIHRDIVRHVEHGAPFPPFESVKAMLPPAQQEKAAAHLRKLLAQQVQENLWFLE